MKKDYSHVCIVLDASGSMNQIRDDVRGSFNAFLEKQRSAPGKTVFDLFRFSDETERIVKSVDLSAFHEDLMAQYYCHGCTAMNDAICTAIDTIGREFADMPEEERPENVLCVIVTDGHENASREFTAEDVKTRITRQQEVYNWEFVFLAANQDAFATGERMGLVDSQCIRFSLSAEDVDDKFNRVMACRMEAVRSGERLKNQKPADAKPVPPCRKKKTEKK